MEWYFTSFIVICSLAAVSSVFTARGFYCRDPDTGKLHEANTTWPSTTFCGSYSCKLRKKNLNANEHLREFNISSTEITKVDEKKTMENCTPTTNVIIEENVNAEDLEKFRNAEVGPSNTGDRYLTEDEIKAMTFLLQTVKKSDLEAILEVYNLAQDIYKEVDKVPDTSLIHEVLREEKSKLEGAKALHSNNGRQFVSYWYEPLTLNSNKHKSDVAMTPVDEKVDSIPVDKTKYADALNHVMFFEQPKLTMENANEATYKPVTKPIHTKLQQDIVGGTFSENDFGKLPYYYPMSKFQRESSYVHQHHPGYINAIKIEGQHATPVAFAHPIANPHPSYRQAEHQNVQYRPLESIFNAGSFPQLFSGDVQRPNPFLSAHQEHLPQSNSYLQSGDSYPEIPPSNVDTYPQPEISYPQATVYTHPELCQESDSAKKPCKPNEPVKKLHPWTRIMNKQYTMDANNRVYELANKQNDNTKVNYQNLNYPLAFLQYNLSTIPNSYFGDTSSWSLLNLYNKHQHQPYLRAAYVAHIPRPVFTNPNEEATPNDKPVHEATDSKIGNLMPEWQTEPLSISVLNEVKANIEDPKLLPFPFRRKVKLEKVGKVYKMDENNRIKRNAENVKTSKDSEYEVYIEKSTCKTDTEPGFFRMGNASEPFPACCPQRITS